MVRARFKLFRRVRAISRAKWSGMFLSGFPIAALVMINVVQPDYYDGEDDLGLCPGGAVRRRLPDHQHHLHEGDDQHQSVGRP